VQRHIHCFDVVALKQVVEARVNIRDAVALGYLLPFDFVYICDGNNLCLIEFALVVEVMLADLPDADHTDAYFICHESSAKRKEKRKREEI
jgi:hypothetical protein